MFGLAKDTIHDEQIWCSSSYHPEHIALSSTGYSFSIAPAQTMEHIVLLYNKLSICCMSTKKRHRAARACAPLCNDSTYMYSGFPRNDF